MGLREVLQGTEELACRGKEKRKPNMIIVWIIIIGIIILAFSGGGDKSKEKETSEAEYKIHEGYEEEQEKRLEQILKKINGAGDVSVFISLDGGGEKVLARDNKSKVSEKSAQNSETVYDEETESQVIMSGKSSSGEPYVVEERTPQIGGVLVVAEGAADEKIRLEIYEAVKALYGISAHRIRVSY